MDLDRAGIRKYLAEMEEYVLRIVNGSPATRDENLNNFHTRKEWIEKLLSGEKPFEGYESPK